MSKTKEITLYGTITISKSFSKKEFILNFVDRSHLLSKIGKFNQNLYMTEEIAEKVWAALVKRADCGEIDLGHLQDAENADDLDVDFDQLVEEEQEKIQSSSPDPQQLSSSPVLSSSSSSASS